MNEKVKVSSEIADAIEYVKECYIKPFETIMRIKSNGGFVEEKTVVLNTLDFLNLGQIMINGYEIEETPEEILMREYMKYFENDSYQAGYEEGIFFTLNVLNIKIKGINEQLIVEG